MADFRVETERLILRDWREDDFGALHALCTCPQVMATIGPLHDAEKTRGLLARLQERTARDGHTFWAMERREDGAMLGFCGLKRANAPGAEPVHGEMEIGWRLREEAWGQGYAREAATASLDLAFDRFGAARVIAFTAAGNAPSQTLMTRLGMRHWPEHDYLDGRFPADAPPNPQVTFGITREEWTAQRASRA